MTKKRLNQVNIIISAVLILLIGLLTGYSLGYFRATAKRFPEIKFIGETNEGIATIKFLEVKNGQLIGETAGRASRLAYSPENILELPPESAFSIPLDQINLATYYQASNVPDGALFVASGKGKYYYSIFTKQAFGIAEKNRLYFSSKEEAEARGYQPK